jgi:hypothetical protein
VTIAESKGYAENPYKGRYKLHMEIFYRYRNVYVRIEGNGDFFSMRYD